MRWSDDRGGADRVIRGAMRAAVGGSAVVVIGRWAGVGTTRIHVTILCEMQSMQGKWKGEMDVLRNGVTHSATQTCCFYTWTFDKILCTDLCNEINGSVVHGNPLTGFACARRL